MEEELKQTMDTLESMSDDFREKNSKEYYMLAEFFDDFFMCDNNYNVEHNLFISDFITKDKAIRITYNEFGIEFKEEYKITEDRKKIIKEIMKLQEKFKNDSKEV